MNHSCSARPAVRLDMLPYVRGGPKRRDVGGRRTWVVVGRAPYMSDLICNVLHEMRSSPLRLKKRTGSDINHPETASWATIEPVLGTGIGHEIGHPDTALRPGLHLRIL